MTTSNIKYATPIKQEIFNSVSLKRGASSTSTIKYLRRAYGAGGYPNIPMLLEGEDDWAAAASFDVFKLGPCNANLYCCFVVGNIRRKKKMKE